MRRFPVCLLLPHRGYEGRRPIPSTVTTGRTARCVPLRTSYEVAMKAIRRFTVRPVLPEPLRPLSDLARNLRWSWHAETRDLFQSVDPECWAASGCDPVRLLGDVPPLSLIHI